MAAFESFNSALIECVRACGGSKVVAHKLWPEKTVDAAQRHLLNCLNEDKPERLTPDHTLMLMRMARKKGCHVGMQFLCAALGYAQPVPIDHRDEAAELKRQFIEAVAKMASMAQRIEQLEVHHHE
jgi:hypothetical protein